MEGPQHGGGAEEAEGEEEAGPQVARLRSTGGPWKWTQLFFVFFGSISCELMYNCRCGSGF